MVGPPARRGDRRFGRRPGRAVARRLFSERGAREVGGLFAYVSSLGYLFCFLLVLVMLRGVSVGRRRGFLAPSPRMKRARDGVCGLVRPQGGVSGGFTRPPLVLCTRVFRTVSFRTALRLRLLVSLHRYIIIFFSS